ncbi:MAG: hypothetical protein NUV94_04780 [Candidatus Acetothermia bacterium]|jgi:hypothetical protein|nr:hypothetical protein [Candidatus Acetothermia bacterium]
MKRWGALFAVAFGVAVAAYPMSLCEYRAPATDLVNGRLSFYYRHFDDPATVGSDISSGQFALSFDRLSDAPGQGFALSGTGEFSLYNLKLARAFVQASGTQRQYLAQNAPYFTFGGFDFSLDTAQAQPGIEVRAGLGYGRFTDVTPLAKALRIERKLLERGAITVALSQATLMAVAQEIGRRAEYEQLADLLAVVENLIEAEAGLTLNARAVLLMEEIIAEVGQERFCGWTAQFGMGYELLDPRGGPRDFLVSFAVDGAIAPEPGSQLLLRAFLSGPYRILEQHSFTLSASYDYQLNETVTFTARYSLRQVKPAGQLPAGNQSAAFQLSFELGGASVSLQVAFSKTAEAPGWTQDFLVSATLDLW